jgi:dTDP-4-dehydrorhamnose 3,5-epimerase
VSETNLVNVYKLETIKLLQGDVLKFLSNHSPGYNGFGEAYFSFVEKDVVKGWKLHTRMTMNLSVPIGAVEFTFFDQNHKFLKFLTVGRKNHQRVVVSPNVWFAFKGKHRTNLVVNCSDICHEPEEALRQPHNFLRFGANS